MSYYRVVNLDKKELLDPASFGEGTKLQEFTEGPAGTMEGLARLLVEVPNGSVEGRWAGDRVVLASVYGPKDDGGMTLYRRAQETFEDISAMVVDHMMHKGGDATRERLVRRSAKSELLRGALQ